jgi:hypothetical protein
MPYYNDPSSDIAAGMQGNFNPMTGRLNTGNMILEFLARMAGQKEKAKQDEWAVEDRDLKKKTAEANIGETKANTERLLRPPVEPAQKGYVLPKSVLKEVAKYHGFTNESEYDSYDPQAQQDMFKEYMDARTAATARGLKVTPTKAGAAKLKMIDMALAQINKRASEIGGELRSFIMQPMSDPKGEGAALDRKILSNLNRLRMRFSTYPWKMDENGTLPEAYEREVIDYLNAPDSVEMGRAFETQSPSRATATTEETIPPSVLAAAKKKRPDLSDEEIIKLWRANKK